MHSNLSPYYQNKDFEMEVLFYAFSLLGKKSLRAKISTLRHFVQLEKHDRKNLNLRVVHKQKHRTVDLKSLQLHFHYFDYYYCYYLQIVTVVIVKVMKMKL